MTTPFSVLIVCQANVCRSPLAEQLMRAHVDSRDDLEIVVTSAGTDPMPGDVQCLSARKWSGAPDTHRSAELTKAMLEQADLVLAADRGNRAVCAVLDPTCRPRLFTIKQAAFLADAVLESPKPEADEPLRWLVGEWDAERVLLSGRGDEDDDIPDRHGSERHDEVFRELGTAIEAILRAFDRIATGQPI